MGRLALVAGTLGLFGLSAVGCDPTGGSSSVAVERKEDAEKREKMIKDLYKVRKPMPIRRRS